ncbi:MAG TPA: hypothetical protein PLR88_00500 [Bacteroidales bacterium]|nr:hypothetical protein [Bacteroidales bacterium]HPT20395.1 hypothetical protein [Bacteroidales bacterium]
MKQRMSLFISVMMVILGTGCIKETYNMNKLSEDVSLSPDFAIKAVKGDISFSDIVEQSDTVVYDNNNFVTIVITRDSVFYLQSPDFSFLNNFITPGKSVYKESEVEYPNPVYYAKAGEYQISAIMETETIDLDIEDALSHISGSVLVADPKIRLDYSNSFTYPVEMTLVAKGRKDKDTVDLDMAPFQLSIPGAGQTDISDYILIDKNNSSLPEIVSLPPEEIFFSGKAVMTVNDENVKLPDGRIYGSLELDVPLELRMNNLQFADTVDSFMDDGDGEDDISADDIENASVIITAKNEFPLEASIEMSLFDSKTKAVKSTIKADKVISAAPVDSNGKTIIASVTESVAKIELNKDFFKWADTADKIIFKFTLNTTDNGSKNVRIYSDYKIDFSAALVLKTNINIE